MARFLVTGGCGFIGCHLVDALLDRGDEVVVLDDLSSGRRSELRAGARLVVGDVADEATVKGLVPGTDGIFHLAAIVSEQRRGVSWQDRHRTNLAGTISVLEAARDAGGIPVVYASSAAVYGDNPNVPLRETERPEPLTAYGADKFAGEVHAGVAGRAHGIPSFGLRLFNAYGPGNGSASGYSGVVSTFVQRMIDGQDVTIDGDGGQVRDFVHVSDVVAHLLLALKAADPSAPVANVCTGQGTSVRQLADMLRELTGHSGKIVHGPGRPGDIRISIGDPDYAIGRFGGLRATIGLSEGLSRLLTSMAAR